MAQPRTQAQGGEAINGYLESYLLANIVYSFEYGQLSTHKNISKCGSAGNDISCSKVASFPGSPRARTTSSDEKLGGAWERGQL